ncbi:MAG: hypothetical protein KUG57_07990 [Ilumatobacteraceae bacterium]|nr:hypothetical protein [Ilumatobacteraceae bacterium]
MTRGALAAGILAVGLTVASCAETVVELDESTGNIDGTLAPTTTIPIVGTTAELLDEMATSMSRLSAQIADDGDERATLSRIEDIWAVALPAVENDDPNLATDIDTTVEMARTAVVRIRPADADKAFQLLVGLAEIYNS